MLALGWRHRITAPSSCPYDQGRDSGQIVRCKLHQILATHTSHLSAQVYGAALGSEFAFTFSTKAKLPTATRHQQRAAFFSHSACQLDWAATNGTDHTIHSATQIAVHAATFTKPRLREIVFSWHHQDRAMVLFTKVYGELSLRIQQSLPRCNNRRRISSACRSARASRSGSPDQRDAQRELVELGKSDTNTNILMSLKCLYDHR